MNSRVLLVSTVQSQCSDRHAISLHERRNSNIDVAVDIGMAIRLLLRNSIYYESIVIDCTNLSFEDVSDFIRMIRERLSPVHPKIIVTKSDLPLQKLILLGVDEVVKDFNAASIDLQGYARFFDIPALAFIEFLVDVIKTKDPSLFDHLKRVKILATLLARLCYENNLIDHKTFENTVLASFFHDLGKMFVPESILHKPSRLTQEEFQIMMQHTILGANLFEKTLRANPKNSLLVTLFQVSKYHHERFDGTGYPCGLTGDQIPVSAKIVAIADVFEALTANRPYRDALTFQQAVELIREDKGHFDPIIVEIFLSNAALFE